MIFKFLYPDLFTRARRSEVWNKIEFFRYRLNLHSPVHFLFLIIYNLQNPILWQLFQKKFIIFKKAMFTHKLYTVIFIPFPRQPLQCMFMFILPANLCRPILRNCSFFFNCPGAGGRRANFLRKFAVGFAAAAASLRESALRPPRLLRNKKGAAFL